MPPSLPITNDQILASEVKIMTYSRKFPFSKNCIKKNGKSRHKGCIFQYEQCSLSGEENYLPFPMRFSLAKLILHQS